MQLLAAMAGATAPGGTVFVGICNPSGRFDRLPRRSPIVYVALAKVDAFVWSYNDQGGGQFAGMIAPHPDLILETLGPLFHRHAWLDYPVTQGAPGWRRRAFAAGGQESLIPVSARSGQLGPPTGYPQRSGNAGRFGFAVFHLPAL